METFKIKPLKEKWQSILNQFSWLLLLLLPYQFGTVAKRMKLRLLRVVRQAVRASLALSNTLETNHRLYIAVVFMLVLAPLTNVGYQLFNESLRGEIAYYENTYYLLFILSPWISLVMFSTGLFLLFPEKSRRAYFLVIPITSGVSKILWLLTITSNEEFHQVIPTYFILPAALIAFIWIFCIDWLLARKYHKYDGIIARIIGLVRINADQKLIESEIKKLQAFNSKY